MEIDGYGVCVVFFRTAMARDKTGKTRGFARTGQQTIYRSVSGKLRSEFLIESAVRVVSTLYSSERNRKSECQGLSTKTSVQNQAHVAIESPVCQLNQCLGSILAIEVLMQELIESSLYVPGICALVGPRHSISAFSSEATLSYEHDVIGTGISHQTANI